MKTIIFVLLFTAIINCMRRGVTQNRVYTPKDEVYLLEGTKYDYQSFMKFSNSLLNNSMEVYPRALVREALAKYLHDKLRISGYFHYDTKSDYD